MTKMINQPRRVSISWLLLVALCFVLVEGAFLTGFITLVAAPQSVTRGPMIQSYGSTIRSDEHWQLSWTQEPGVTAVRVELRPVSPSSMNLVVTLIDAWGNEHPSAVQRLVRLP